MVRRAETIEGIVDHVLLQEIGKAFAVAKAGVLPDETVLAAADRASAP
jgi:hypothetical protein